MHRLLDLDDPPTAVFAASDLFAARVLQSLYERPRRAPDDISVAGFDVTYAAYLTSPLTTVEQPMVEMGRVAANRVFLRLAQPDDATRARTARTRLIVRASSGPASEKGGCTVHRAGQR
jgi:LacI family transcriptional regulator